MNLLPQWASMLSDARFTAVHWTTVGLRNAPDVEIMGYAASNDYIVLTHDLDFGAILAATHGAKLSVVRIRADDVRPDAILEQVISALHQVETELEDGALITVTPKRTRLRVLPFRSRD